MCRLLAVLLVCLWLTGCADDPAPEAEVHTAPNGDRYNDADVEFATAVIQETAESLALVDETVGRDLDPALLDLAARIRDRQVTVVEDLVTVLQDWQQPVPETVRDHVNAPHEHGADGAPAAAAWLEQMASHHSEALGFAEREREDGENAELVALAAELAAQTERELKELEALRG